MTETLIEADGHPPARTPVTTPRAQFGSDAVVELLQRLGVDHIAINPGASFRGLHDSLVNHAGDHPHLITCLHEEHAVSIAHGYAKAAGRPMAVALHTNVGLMHASMAIFNAYCDRAPMLVLAGTGPLDAARRRPWIDWVHTSIDLPALVRGFLKWDDVPTSLAATLDSVALAWDVARTEPCGPTLVVLDSSVQEAPLDGPTTLPAPAPAWAEDIPEPSDGSVERALEILRTASRPVVLMGSTGLDRADLDQRVALVEALNARVITDLKANASFPSTHPANAAAPGIFLTPDGRRLLADADVVVALGWLDVAGTLGQAGCGPDTPLIVAGLDHLLANGTSPVHRARVAPTVLLPGTPDVVVRRLVQALGADVQPWAPVSATAVDGPAAAVIPGDTGHELTLTTLAREVRRAVTDRAVTVVRLPLGASGDDWSFDEPLDFLGSDGGAGVGSAVGMTIGAALALRGTERIALGVIGDGEFLMGVQALWTAAHERLPMLLVVANNRTYFNDEVHQERVAIDRGRDASRRSVGLSITDPVPSIAGLSSAQGVRGIGPVKTPAELLPALQGALAEVDAGRAVVLDVWVRPGYSAAMEGGLNRD